MICLSESITCVPSLNLCASCTIPKENGTYTPKHEVIDLGEICAKAAALQSPRMRQSVKLELDVPAPNGVYVISDSVLLLQYLSNLLSNAAKFTSGTYSS